MASGSKIKKGGSTTKKTAAAKRKGVFRRLAKLRTGKTADVPF